MRIGVGFIKIHQAVYEISVLTLLPLEALIFGMKSEEMLNTIISWATLTNKIWILVVLGTRNSYFHS